MQEPGSCLSGQDNIPGIPGEFIFPWIIIVSRSYQSTCIGFKNINLTPFLSYPVYDLHGRHMVNAGIHSHFIEQQYTLFPGLGIKSPDLLRYIGCRYQGLPAISHNIQQAGNASRQAAWRSQYRQHRSIFPACLSSITSNFIPLPLG